MKTPKILDTPQRRAVSAAVGLLAGAGLLAGCALFHPHIFKAEAGLQLYSVRAQMAKDPEGTLAEVHSWGIKYIELAGTYGMTPEKFEALLSEHDLDAVSGHFSFDEWSKNPEAVLRQTNQKFERRFSAIEHALAAQGKAPRDATLAEMDAHWNEAKARE